MSCSINIVSFDVPYPANYGGVIDVYYKLYRLWQAGVKIHLHCFAYGRSPAPELALLCEKVYYYKRRTGLWSNFSLLPYTVKSRQALCLETNLLSNNYPILFEVLHTCYLLNDPRFKERKKIYRHSNIEHDYYNELSRSERNIVKKIFLKLEALKLKRFESILRYANLILAVNRKDVDYFSKKYPGVRAVYLPSFHANISVVAEQGRGDYILFHGNLGVSENYEAATWLIENVFSKIEHPVVIAGLNPPTFLNKLCKMYKHMRLIENPPATQMSEIVSNAQVHVLYTAQPTGLKLKLLNVLFAGRFVVLNDYMVSGTTLCDNGSLITANSASDFVTGINNLYTKNFSAHHLAERQQQLADFGNEANAARLISEISDSL